MENKNLIMRSEGKSKKSIIYTLDAVSGIFKTLFEGEKGEVYNLTNPNTFLTVKEFEIDLKRWNFSWGEK